MVKQSLCFKGTIEIVNQGTDYYGAVVVPGMSVGGLFTTVDDRDRYFLVSVSAQLTNIEDIVPFVQMYVLNLNVFGTFDLDPYSTPSAWTKSFPVVVVKGSSVDISFQIRGASAADIGTTADYVFTIQEL